MTDSQRYDATKYKRDFGFFETSSSDTLGKRRRAFELAEEIRRFEIELYWKRATYFWTFIGATFAGYLAVNAADNDVLALLLSGIGLIFSIAWWLANRGSKFWQENWENHVDNLENSSVGPLYKVVLARPKPPKGNFGLWMDYYLIGPKKVSVSKINQVVSLYITLIWICLWIYSISKSLDLPTIFSIEYSLIGVTVLGIISFFVLGNTYSGKMRQIPDLRENTIHGVNVNADD